MSGSPGRSGKEANPAALPRPGGPKCRQRSAPPSDQGLRQFLEIVAEIAVEAVLRKRSGSREQTEATIASPGGPRKRPRTGATRPRFPGRFRSSAHRKIEG